MIFSLDKKASQIKKIKKITPVRDSKSLPVEVPEGRYKSGPESNILTLSLILK